MITSEQILQILNTWTIYNGFKYEEGIILRLVSPNKQYFAEFSKYIIPPDNSKSFEFKLAKIKDIDLECYNFILIENTPNDIQLEVEYLVTKKVKEYVSKELDKIFA